MVLECVDEVSLERNKIYVILSDVNAERDGDLRVVDESGEDDLFSADRFAPIDVPAAVKASPKKPRSDTPAGSATRL